MPVVSDNFLFVIRFNNERTEMFFSSQQKELVAITELLEKTNSVIKDIKVYERANTKFVRTNKQTLYNIFSCYQPLIDVLTTKNFF